ncbi:MAG: hypothetical protein IOC90_09890 [Methylocystis sp.]|nr:hypothetical protein [Methylocystis sp.]MCA3584296.1 hypothetical protein [Methylocystis sp.]MCA3588328.1 hypothetical protein [Methylocystis sp.]MCA3590919.1 hypothetical protein [Methylocystis sp.]
MRRTFYFLIIGCVALIWLGHRMRLALERLMTGHPGDHALDMRFFGYSTEDVAGYFQRLGAEGRKDYLRIQYRIELAFIIAYGISGAAAGMWTASALYAEKWSLLSWLPFLGGLLVAAAAIVDLDEGSAIRKLLKTYPRLDETAVRRASQATRLKWLCLFAGLMLVLLGVGMFAIAKLKWG